MDRVMGLAMLVVGAGLVMLGIAASDSVSSDFSRLFSGHATPESIWMLLGGFALVILGIRGWVTSRSSANRA